MRELIDRRGRVVATVGIVAGVALFLWLELREEPDRGMTAMLLELVEIVPIVVASVGVGLLMRALGQQREDQRALLRDLEVARLEGRRWRAEARAHLNGLGDAIDAQFGRWHLTEAEREVALLLLKGLSLREISAVRAATERTIRAQAQAIYGKAGVTGRAALSAFFLEDLLAPISDGADRAP